MKDKKYFIYFTTFFILFFISLAVSNEYYTKPDYVSAASRARSAKINEIIDSVDAGFDNIPVNLQDTIDALTAQSGVVVSSDDSSVGYLDNKLVVGDVITKSVLNPGGSETLQITVPDDAVTYSKIQNVVGNNVFLGNDGGAGSIIEELSSSAARTILNVEDGADITDAINVGAAINGVTGKTTPVDADTVALIDSADSNLLKKLSWTNIKATLKTYFDTLYISITTPQLGGDLDTNGNQIQESSGANVASASALPILTDGNYFVVTGTSSINTINTSGNVGTKITLQFSSTPTLVYNATDLILPGNANIIAEAGDIAIFREYASGDWICESYTRDRGVPVTGITIGTSVETSSGTSVNFTGIPSGVKRITLMLKGVSTNGTSGLLVQIRDSGGLENTGYVSTCSIIGGGPATSDSTSGFIIRNNSIVSGTMVLNLENPTNNTWVSTLVTKESTTQTLVGGGDKSLSGVLDGISLLTLNGSDVFDAGEININYE